MWIRRLYNNQNNLQINTIIIEVHRVIKIKNGTKIEKIDKNNLNRASRSSAKKGKIIGSREGKRVKFIKTQFIRERDLDMKKDIK